MVAPSRLALLVSIAVALSATNAHAESASQRGARLLRQGRAALDAKQYDQACALLAESEKLSPHTGTLLYLALCHEGQGRTASAWREFNVVLAAPDARGDTAALADAHVRGLEVKVSKVTVSVPNARALVGKLHVRLDGQELPVSSWNAGFAVDPGDHLIDATMAGMEPWRARFHVDEGALAQSKTLIMPDPVPVPAAAAAAPPPRAEQARPRWLAWGLVGGGGAALIVGSVLGALALSDHSSAKGLCPSSPCTNASGVSDESRAMAEGWVSTFAIGIGVLAAGAGVYLLVRPLPGGGGRELAVAPWLGSGSAGASLSARF